MCGHDCPRYELRESVTAVHRSRDIPGSLLTLSYGLRWERRDGYSAGTRMKSREEAGEVRAERRSAAATAARGRVLSPAQLRRALARIAKSSASAQAPSTPRTTLWASAVAPRRVHVSWRIAASDLRTAEREVPAARPPLVLRIYRLGAGPDPESWFDCVLDHPEGQRTVEVRWAEGTLAAELGLLRPDGRLRRLSLAGPVRGIAEAERSRRLRRVIDVREPPDRLVAIESASMSAVDDAMRRLASGRFRAPVVRPISLRRQARPPAPVAPPLDTTAPAVPRPARTASDVLRPTAPSAAPRPPLPSASGAGFLLPGAGWPLALRGRSTAPAAERQA